MLIFPSKKKKKEYLLQKKKEKRKKEYDAQYSSLSWFSKIMDKTGVHQFAYSDSLLESCQFINLFDAKSIVIAFFYEEFHLVDLLHLIGQCCKFVNSCSFIWTCFYSFVCRASHAYSLQVLHLCFCICLRACLFVVCWDLGGRGEPLYACNMQSKEIAKGFMLYDVVYS